jgi:hypothetical protein
MLSRLGRITIWKYADDVPIERLHRHHRLASRICMVGFGSGALMTSSMAEFLASGEGWGRTISMVVLFTSGTICLLMIVPSIIAWAWGEEVEKEFTARGLPLPDGGRMRKRLPRTAMKMFYWFIGMAIIAYFAQPRR